MPKQQRRTLKRRVRKTLRSKGGGVLDWLNIPVSTTPEPGPATTPEPGQGQVSTTPEPGQGSATKNTLWEFLFGTKGGGRRCSKKTMKKLNKRKPI